MFKRILVIFFILILIITIAIVSLIVFVDPNNFRGFISSTVKDKTGYELTIEGNLRWHIWPQVSILSDSVTLSNSGAQKPILTADNMRLDVELLPLFSKKLAIKNVFIKSAIINVTNESKGQNTKSLPQSQINSQATTTNQTPSETELKNSTNWANTLSKFEITDSTIVVQHNDDLVNFRNLNLIVEQTANKTVTVDLKGNVDRNQQDLLYSVQANVNLAQFPEQAIIEVKNIDYTYKGIGVPSGELKGNIKATFDYQQSPLILKSQNLIFSVNNNNFTGMLVANLDKKPEIELLLNTDKIDITPFLQPKGKTNENTTIQQTAPVVSSVNNSNNELSVLSTFNAKANIDIKELIANQIILNNINSNFVNNEGITTFNNISFDFAKGKIVATGTANGKQKNTQIKLNTKINNVDLNTFFKQIETPNDLEGTFNATGDLEAYTFTPSKLIESLRGNFAINVTKAKLVNINIQNIIQAAAAQYTRDITPPENQKNYTEFDKILAKGYLNNGNMELNSLTANSGTLDVIEGSGRVGMIKHDLDVNLSLKMLGGWHGKSETITKLQQLTIPLHIFGKFANLHYQIDMEKLIKDLFENKLQQSLDKLRNKLENRDSKDDSKSKKHKAADILGGLLIK
ncbi:outer membrane assembly protein AsmA [Gilliamella sp. wkB112]|uniref:outer membrane assembly protein AsmA n=1 Tax=Gilliamella sp. wkB112 TaxID=3120257 RepID=UPI00080E7E76|nr:outer membrane assembly protein AsmA [Gilliamella apicola]OCG01350.1 hypothetical protein A9G12_02035 [Gilliamella apicola]